MTYQETLDWLFAQLPMYQRQGAANYKINLDKIQALAQYLENPQKEFKSIHVAGTNGKGSTSHMLASVLQEAGYNVGLYTSPHLKDFRERIRLNGEVVSKQFVIGFVKKHKAYFEAHQLSFFEMTVGMAFAFFASKKVDVAVIEVGLGGRLDATNIITPELSVITNIGMDHTQFLGNTLPEIATEKAGIIKEGVPVIIGEYQKETEEVFSTLSRKRNAPLHKAYDFNLMPMESDLLGSYQKQNMRTVQVAISVLQDQGFAVGIQHIAKGLKNVVKNTGLLGRWQTLQESPKVICDTGHNAEGLHYVVDQLSKEKFERLHIVLGMVSDKDLVEVLPIFPTYATYYFCKPDIPRGMEVAQLSEAAKSHKLIGEAYASVNEALDTAKKTASPADLIFVGGSTFVVAEVV
ncbi:bifunctional folylpolyglutamate synthase/dihydrofolate synthase [Dokdonia sinensis]|uniref:Dihydrofolate synthase/folylpolyglutamate synthase n=1 Tax=Dokdonia sinensis TaxID=2479847 RepID=A0A3M0FWV6_9FLAO|nr:folylpolyglutamate synthase/dihydrofolate synthase family protein [Dokdonia sinensis]RMB57144.1 bifunctional folylpolyglutamate synthase/dihydrofolate synthase [Dokdonia sinensis]